jgi:hypothetical protein
MLALLAGYPAGWYSVIHSYFDGGEPPPVPSIGSISRAEGASAPGIRIYQVLHSNKRLTSTKLFTAGASMGEIFSLHGRSLAPAWSGRVVSTAPYDPGMSERKARLTITVDSS